jgi:predicted transcriptional regulator of viral defense system
LALSILNVICAILGALEIVDGNKWLTRLKTTNYSTEPLELAEKLEIALSVVIMAFACTLAYLSYEMSRQFGWNIYKKIGADVQVQSKCVVKNS